MLENKNLEDDITAQKVRKRRKNLNIFQRFMRSRSGDYFFLKFPFGGVFGAAMGYAYYKALFAGAFQENEKTLDFVVFCFLTFTTSFACASSVQCRCIGMLCLPAMLGKTGKALLKATLTTWILAGPIANILVNINVSITSMTCVAKLHSKQMQSVFHMLHAPVTSGLSQIVNDTSLINDTELILKLHLKRMKADLWAKPRKTRELRRQIGNTTHRKRKRRSDMKKYIDKLKDIKFEEPENPAKKLHDDAYDRCMTLFEMGVAECVRLMRRKELACRKSIGIPFIGWLICSIFKFTFICNIVKWFDTWCGEIPELNEAKINQNYKDMETIEKKLESEFRTKMLWKIPIEKDEASVVLTVNEVIDRIERDMHFKKLCFEFVVAVIKKLIAISFIFVIQAAKNYNMSYLTDFRFDNLYITSYFRRKDKERKVQGKRFLLPLTRIEGRNMVSSFIWKLTAAERKAIFFRLLKITVEGIFTGVIFFFDYVIFYVLHLIRKHGRTEMTISGKHILEVDIEGDGMVAVLLRRLFIPFKDNKYFVESNSTNLECLPQPVGLPASTYVSICGMYGLFYLLLFFDAYALRLRHIIAGFAYRRRHKKRIIFLYGDLLRRRKNHLAHVRMIVKKLAKKYHLQQRYSFMQAVRLSWPQLEYCFSCLGIGARQCVICEDKETKKRRLISCRKKKCHLNYCDICWKEVGTRCWACDDDVTLPEDEVESLSDYEAENNQDTDD